MRRRACDLCLPFALPLAARQDGRKPGMHKGSALCCGFGGVLQIMNPELSRDLATKCWDGLDARAEVLTGCSGCTLQLASHAPEGTSVRHWLDVVDA